MKEKLFRKGRIVLVATIAFAACPGDDIAMFAAALGPAIPGSSSLNIHENSPHDAILDRRKIEAKPPTVRSFKLPKNR